MNLTQIVNNIQINRNEYNEKFEDLKKNHSSLEIGFHSKLSEKEKADQDDLIKNHIFQYHPSPYDTEVFNYFSDFKIIEIIRAIFNHRTASVSINQKDNTVFLIIQEHNIKIKKDDFNESKECDNWIDEIIKDFFETRLIGYELNNNKDICVLTKKLGITFITNKIWENNKIEPFYDDKVMLSHKLIFDSKKHIAKNEFSIALDIIKNAPKELCEIAEIGITLQSIIVKIQHPVEAHKDLVKEMEKLLENKVDDILLIELWDSFQSCQEEITKQDQEIAKNFKPKLQKLQKKIVFELKKADLFSYIERVDSSIIYPIINLFIDDVNYFQKKF